jgi:hypothetical protein
MTTADDAVEIAASISRYAYAVDFGEFDAFRAALADDVEVHFVMQALGRDDVIVHGADAAIERMAARPAPMVPRHALCNHIVDVDGDVARSRAYLANGSATYAAEHRHTASGWRISRLEVRLFPPPE